MTFSNSAAERRSSDAAIPQKGPVEREAENPHRADGHTVMVTGGAGYVGAILTRTLLHAGYKVICIDNLRFGGHSLLDVWDHPLLRFEKADITDDAAMDRLIDEHRNCLAIIHLAAIVGDPACKLEPDLARKTNLDATVRLVKMAAASGIARFVFASTCSNYGKMKEIGGYVDEDSPLAPVSLYAELKVGAEQFILSTMPKTDGFCPTCLRFATVYGLSPRMRFDLTVNEFTRDIALGREVVVFGEQFWRPYCHVRDFSKAILAVLRECREKVAYRVFNVGDTAENYTKRMLMEELLRLEPGGRVKYVRKEEDPRDYRVNFARIRRELNFRISRTVPQGMKDILTSLRLGVVPDPDHQRYHNTPLVT